MGGRTNRPWALCSAAELIDALDPLFNIGGRPAVRRTPAPRLPEIAMRTTFCMTGLTIAGLTLTAAAMGSQTSGKPKPDAKAQAVIEAVERTCLEPPYVYTIGSKRGQRLAELVRKQKPRLVVECGTAIGYSGLWIALELKRAGKGKLITIEFDPKRVKTAKENFRKAGLEKYVTVLTGDARKLVKEIEGPIDFVFIDCGFSNYHACLTGLQKQIAPGATIVADNVGVGADSMKDYLKVVRSKYKSHVEWFDVNQPWGKRDAMEISVVPK